MPLCIKGVIQTYLPCEIRTETDCREVKILPFFYNWSLIVHDDDGDDDVVVYIRACFRCRMNMTLISDHDHMFSLHRVYHHLFPIRQRRLLITRCICLFAVNGREWCWWWCGGGGCLEVANKPYVHRDSIRFLKGESLSLSLIFVFFLSFSRSLSPHHPLSPIIFHLLRLSLLFLSCASFVSPFLILLYFLLRFHSHQCPHQPHWHFWTPERDSKLTDAQPCLAQKPWISISKTHCYVSMHTYSIHDQ